MSVVSLEPQPGHLRDAADVVALIGQRLAVAPRIGDDGSWELEFEVSYVHAHARVVAALDQADPSWPARVAVDYALVA